MNPQILKHCVRKTNWITRQSDHVIYNLKFSYFYKFLKLILNIVAVIFSNNQLSASTLCMVTEQGEKGEYRHYDVHSMYGLTGLIATRK